MSYRKTTKMTANKNIIEKCLYYSWRALPSSPKARELRAKRVKVSTDQQKEINRHRAQKNLMMLIADNFKEKDLYLTLTYADKVPPADQMNKDMDAFLKGLRKIYKNSSTTLKYIAILENLHGGGRGHGHILINSIAALDLSMLKSIWSCGRIKAELFGGTIDDCSRLAAYFKKETVVKKSGRIRTSQSLSRPAEKKEQVTRSECYNTAHIRPPKGYYLHEKLSILDGRTAEGYPYAYIIFVKDGT